MLFSYPLPVNGQCTPALLRTQKWWYGSGWKTKASRSGSMAYTTNFWSRLTRVLSLSTTKSNLTMQQQRQTCCFIKVWCYMAAQHCHACEALEFCVLSSSWLRLIICEGQHPPKIHDFGLRLLLTGFNSMDLSTPQPDREPPHQRQN